LWLWLWSRVRASHRFAMAFAIVLLRRFFQRFYGLGVCVRLFEALYRRVFDASGAPMT
jgi:hypothetical protein